MRHELELARLNQELELERVRVSAREVRDDVSTESGISGRSVVDHRLVQISMPRFDDRVESIDDFLTQFEKLAQVHGIPAQHWAINVSAFLQGSARDVYHSLSSNESDEYAVLKKALLRHYRLTAENYRKMFRESTKKGSETHSQFHARVRGLFERWIKMAEVEQTYEGLREIILKEHVLNTYRKDLTIFLAEREHRTLEEIANMAERYELAHPKSSNASRNDRTSELNSAGEEDMTVCDRRNDGKAKEVYSGRDKPKQFSSTQNGFNGRRGPPTCFTCKRVGHVAKDCNKDKVVQVNLVTGGESRISVSGKATNLASGTVNGNPVTILYDTGSSTPVLVRNEFVKPGTYTGKSTVVQFANCTRDLLREAEIDLDSPYVKGKVKALCSEELPYDVVLGSYYILPKPNPETCGAVSTCVDKSSSSVERTKTESTDVTYLDSISQSRLKKLQREDVTLALLRKYASAGTEKETRYGRVKFIYNKGILYRLVRKGNERFRQIVVPKSERNEVLKHAHESALVGHSGVSATRVRLYSECYWPGAWRDVKQYCSSCKECRSSDASKYDYPLVSVVTTFPASKPEVSIVEDSTEEESEGGNEVYSLPAYLFKETESKQRKQRYLNQVRRKQVNRKRRRRKPRMLTCYKLVQIP